MPNQSFWKQSESTHVLQKQVWIIFHDTAILFFFFFFFCQTSAGSLNTETTFSDTALNGYFILSLVIKYT